MPIPEGVTVTADHCRVTVVYSGTFAEGVTVTAFHCNMLPGNEIIAIKQTDFATKLGKMKRLTFNRKSNESSPFETENLTEEFRYDSSSSSGGGGRRGCYRISSFNGKFTGTTATVVFVNATRLSGQHQNTASIFHFTVICGYSDTFLTGLNCS